MKILVAGSSGSIGQRYCAILRHLGHDVLPYDTAHGNPQLPDSVDGCIVATPTCTHSAVLLKLAQSGIKKFLCEKPVSEHTAEITFLKGQVPGIRVVCNWKYLYSMGKPGTNLISYNYYHSSSDDARWNLCQPIYMADKFVYDSSSPIWTVTVNGHLITYQEMERSYLFMIEDWLTHPSRLWSMTDAKKMTEKAGDWNAAITN